MRSTSPSANTASTAAIMITASHNPAKYNGIKFSRDEAIAISIETGPGGRFATKRSPATSRRRPRDGTISQRDILDDFAEHCLSLHRRSRRDQAVQDRDRRRQRHGRARRFRTFSSTCRARSSRCTSNSTARFRTIPRARSSPRTWSICSARSSSTAATSASRSTATPTACSSSTRSGGLIGGDIVTALVGVNTLAQSRRARSSTT